MNFLVTGGKNIYLQNAIDVPDGVLAKAHRHYCTIILGSFPT